MAVAAGGTNPISVVDDNPMSVRQWIVVILMIFLNALDGFDVFWGQVQAAQMGNDLLLGCIAVGKCFIANAHEPRRVRQGTVQWQHRQHGLAHP